MPALPPSRYAAVRAQALAAGDPQDRDLPAEDRRTRARIVQGRDLTPQQTIEVEGYGEVTVLGPARGRDYVLVAFTEPGLVLPGYETEYSDTCIAQVPVASIRDAPGRKP